MSDTQKLESTSLGMYVTPEVTARRLSKIIRIFLDSKKDSHVESILQELVDPMTLSRIVKDSNFWISSALENKVLNKVNEYFSLSDILFNSGKDFFYLIVLRYFPPMMFKLVFKN